MRKVELPPVDRPLGEPLPVTELAIAVDDPPRFQKARYEPGAATTVDERSALLAWLSPADLAESLA